MPYAGKDPRKRTNRKQSKRLPAKGTAANPLTPRALLFIAALLADPKGNQRQAAVAAGCKLARATTQACRWMKDPRVEAAIVEGRRRLARKLDVTAERVLLQLARIAFQDPRLIFRADGSPKNPVDLDDDAAPTLAGYEGASDKTPPKVRLHDPMRALDLLTRHLGLIVERTFNVDPSQLTDEQIRRLIAGEDVLAVLASTPKS